jgi:hypothetical protein
MQAMRAAVHLRHPHLDEFEQLRIEAFGDPALDGDETLDAAVFAGQEIQTPGHVRLHNLG